MELLKILAAIIGIIVCVGMVFVCIVYKVWFSLVFFAVLMIALVFVVRDL